MATTLLYHSKFYPVDTGISPTLVFPGGTGHGIPARGGDQIGIRNSTSPSSTVVLDVGSNWIEDPDNANKSTGTLITVLERISLFYVFDKNTDTWLLINRVEFGAPQDTLSINSVEISIGGTTLVI